MPIFDKTIILTGKHAYYADMLKERGFFNRILDVYINAPLVGLTYNRKSDKDRSPVYKDVDKKIFMEQISKELSTLEFVYRLTLLLDQQQSIPLEERVNRAFRDDAFDDISKKHEENMSLFNSYVLGGIEILYEKIIAQGATNSDFIRNAYAFMKEQNLSISDQSADNLIDTII